MNKFILLALVATLFVVSYAQTDTFTWEYFNSMDCSGTAVASAQDLTQGACNNNPTQKAGSVGAAPESARVFEATSGPNAGKFSLEFFDSDGCATAPARSSSFFSQSELATGVETSVPNCVLSPSMNSYLVTMGTTGVVVQDPHFYPLSSNSSIAAMQYTPRVPDGVYNIFSNKYFQWNSKFESFNDLPFAVEFPQFVEEDAFMVRNPVNKQVVRVTFKPSPDSEMKIRLNLAVEIEGRTIPLIAGQKHFLFGEEHPGYFVVAVNRWKARLETPEIRVLSGAYYLDLAKRGLKREAAKHPKFKWNYLNTKIYVEDDAVDRDSHGLLGQTLRPECPYKAPHKECIECFVKGKLSDYRLDDDKVFGTGFRYNKF